jgi:hypothetical protein
VWQRFRTHDILTSTKERTMPRASAPNDLAGVVAEQPELDRFDPVNRRRLSAPGLRTFLRIADHWGLNEQQRLLILGYPSRSRYNSWCKRVQQHEQLTLNVDVLMRISAVLGIYQGLRVLNADEQHAVEWLRTPHKAIIFGGHPPLDLVTCGTQDSLLTVRRFLDSACGGHYMPPGKLDAGFLGYDDADIVVRLAREV